MRAGLIACKALTALLFLMISGASQTWAAPCINPPISPQAIAQFKSNPNAMVAPDMDARTIEAMVRDLVGTDPGLTDELISVAKGTTPRFRTAIAAGLAQAAVACSTVDQHAGLLIQQGVASFEDSEFQSAFAAVAGDLSTAAAEVAFESAVGSVGSVVVVNPNLPPKTTTNPGGGGLPSPALFQIVSGTTIASTLLTSRTTTRTASSPVSATR
jgi:hypothetical protein